MCYIHVHLPTSSGRQQLAAHAHLHVAALPPAEQNMGHAAGGKQHPAHPAACRTALGTPRCPTNIGVQLRKAVGSRKKSSMRAFYFILFYFGSMGSPSCVAAGCMGPHSSGKPLACTRGRFPTSLEMHEGCHRPGDCHFLAQGNLHHGEIASSCTFLFSGQMSCQGVRSHQSCCHRGL